METNYSCLPLKTLIRMCIINNKDAWNEFFRRFTPVIHRSIKNNLRAKGLISMATDIDIIEEIYIKVVELVWYKNELASLKNPDACVGWLQEISINKTNDWIRSNNRQKNLARKQAEESMHSLAEPQNEDGSITLQDKIISEEPLLFQNENILHKYTNELRKLSVKELWVMRIKLMFYDPLTAAEVMELSQYIKKPAEEISVELEKILGTLLIKNQKKEKRHESAGRIHATIINLQGRIVSKKHINDIAQEEQNRIKTVVDRKERSLHAIRKNLDSFIEPSNEQIAAMLGLPKEKVGGISLIVHRARKKLKEGLKKEIFQ
jgi:DNA-directed RNA polymerase specialized sigma24 family protein